MRKLSFFLSLIITMSCFSVLLSQQAYAAYAPPFDVTSTSVIIYNVDTDTIVYEKNADKRIAPASLTKLMTCIIAYDMIGDLEHEMVTLPSRIFDEFIGLDISHASLQRGETVSMATLVNAMLVTSANEAASAAAYYLGGGSIDAFAQKMNDKAASLGCTDTNFVNAHGLFDEDQYTTARDMLKIAKCAINTGEIFEISNKLAYFMPDTNKKKGWWIYGRNAILQSSSQYYYSSASGLKTGYLPEVGRHLITTATKNGYTYISIVMGANDVMGEIDDKGTIGVVTTAAGICYAESKNLLEWSFDVFKRRSVNSTDEIVASIPVKYALGEDNIKVTMEEEIKALIPNSIDISTVTKTLTLPEYVVAPIEKGQILGSVVLTLGDEVLGETNVVAVQSMSKSTMAVFVSKLKDMVFSVWFKIVIILLIVLIAGYILLTIMSNNKRRYKRR